MSGKKWYLFILLFPAIAFTLGIYFQVKYLESMHRMRNEQFSTLVKTALAETMQEVEKDAITRFTYELITKEGERRRLGQLIEGKNTDSSYTDPLFKLHEWNLLLQSSRFATWPRSMVHDTLLNVNVLSDYPDEEQQRLVNAFFYYSERLTEVVLNSIIGLDNDIRPLEMRIDCEVLESKLNETLRGGDIREPFIYRIYDHNGEVFKSNDENLNIQCEENQIVRRTLFEGQLFNRHYAGYIELCFPYHKDYMNPNQYATFSIVMMASFILLMAVLLILFSRQVVFLKNRKNFVNNLTHELKTPLTSIMLATDMLEETSALEKTPSQERIYNVLKSETKRLSYIVEKVLQFTLVDERKVRFYPKNVDIREILEDIKTVYSIKCDTLGGSMTLSLEAENMEIYVDKLHFQNVLFNLMDNAVKYRKMDEPIELTVRCYNRNRNSVTISVIDNGIGISRMDQKRIFKQYYRVETGNVHNVKGFGLGLSYVQRTVIAMGGTVEVESKKGVGTTMSVTFPLTKVEKRRKKSNE